MTLVSTEEREPATPAVRLSRMYSLLGSPAAAANKSKGGKDRKASETE